MVKEKLDEAELRRSQSRRGMSLEDRVTAANQRYLQLGLAFMVKQPTPWQVFRRGKDYKAVPAKKGTVDFFGFYYPRDLDLAVPGAVECKRFTGTSFPLAEDHLRTVQLRFLEDWERLGGLSFVLFDVERLGQCFLVPAHEVFRKVAEMSAGGRKSLPLEWFTGREAVREVDGLFDYLGLCKEVA